MLLNFQFKGGVRLGGILCKDKKPKYCPVLNCKNLNEREERIQNGEDTFTSLGDPITALPSLTAGRYGIS